jgi:hypothetical protein
MGLWTGVVWLRIAVMEDGNIYPVRVKCLNFHD